MMRVNRHATGWITRIAESVVRVEVGRLKLALSETV
jgi:hypothetical protein